MKEKDNWSLKGKGMRSYPDGKPIGIYSQEVIDILREKLIEEFSFYFDSYLYFAIDEQPDKDNFLYDIKKIINKRFGVEE